MIIEQLVVWQTVAGIAVLLVLLLLGWIFITAAKRRGQRDELEHLRHHQAVSNLKEQQQSAQLVGQDREIASLRDKLDLSDNRVRQLQQQLAVIETRRSEESRRYREQMELVQREEERLTQSFQNLANKIFEEKRQAFKQDNKDSLEALLSPLRSQMQDFRQRVEDVYEKDTDDRRMLRLELGSLKDLNLKMSQEAQALTRALKGDNKIQGNWGEMVLEKILQESGLRKGHEYDVQVVLKDEAGKRQIPDVIVHLPENKDIIIDSKVSLLDYERTCNAETDELRVKHLRAHVDSVKRHIQLLSAKNYERLEGVRSLDFVLLFIPVEAAFMLAVETDSGIFTSAFEKNIILVSPTTLLATLRTVQSIWRYENQNTNAERIAQDAGRLYDQFVMVLESVNEIGRHLNKASESYEQTVKRLESGRGNLLGRVEKLKAMGATAKKNLPENFAREADDAQELLDSSVVSADRFQK
ncbi:DNA recombination protein RmuC [Gynuella sunshinyii]|uniref:DNA recombination protein RmuC n=1 Tax=Gynuella sunshinyii YC6258 TaxID=1445510 RepID=A0A0C5VTZ1_9GAMM|nr:DNA recombination protein RmuC [Gynuella sunshinyii]AJQ96738.1 hypothetical protein YC6258_04706 [Gynuella sunshinyii YC6258]